MQCSKVLSIPSLPPFIPRHGQFALLYLLCHLLSLDVFQWFFSLRHSPLHSSSMLKISSPIFTASRLDTSSPSLVLQPKHQIQHQILLVQPLPRASPRTLMPTPWLLPQPSHPITLPSQPNPQAPPSPSPHRPNRTGIRSSPPRRPRLKPQTLHNRPKRPPRLNSRPSIPCPAPRQPIRLHQLYIPALRLDLRNRIFPPVPQHHYNRRVWCIWLCTKRTTQKRKCWLYPRIEIRAGLDT